MEPKLDNLFTDEKIAEIYAKHSGSYHDYQEALRAFSKLVPLENRILEIGVGTGTFTELLLSEGYNVQGIDRSGEMLKRSSKRVQSLSRECDLFDCNSSENYDTIFSHSGGFTFKGGKFETYYQKREDLEFALKKIYMLLREGGEISCK